MPKKREIILVILLSLITCGLYCFYWMVVTQDDLNVYTEENETPGILVLLFTLISCGIYGFFWYYKISKRIYNYQIEHGLIAGDNSVLNVLLAIFGFSLVSNCIIQNDLNKLYEKII